MKLIVGLGNPGPNHIKARHNFGFMACQYLKDNFAADQNWRNDGEFKSLLVETAIENEKIILAKPQTMMNASGLAVKSLADYYKISPPDIWIFHDDLDLPLGVLRLNQGASSAGHLGVQSIIESLGNKNFIRVRLGIHPIGQTFFLTFFKKLTSTKKFVLQKFTKSEETVAKETIKKAADALQVALKEGLEKAKSQFN
jgi:PTH1 family peptidyl-tRNA hydrolase